MWGCWILGLLSLAIMVVDWGGGCSIGSTSAAIITLFNDCYGPHMLVTVMAQPNNNSEILYEGTPPIGDLMDVDIYDAQSVIGCFSIPTDQLEINIVLEGGAHVLTQDYLVLKGHHHRVGIIGYLTDNEGTIQSALFQL